MIWPEPEANAEAGEVSTVQRWPHLKWTVAYCKPRQEKSLAWDLFNNKIPYFLPMVLRETSSGGRRRRNLYPLFPSYLFFASNDFDSEGPLGPNASLEARGQDGRTAVLRTERTVHLINIHEAEQSTFTKEIESLEKTLRICPDSLELYPRFVPGKRTTIKSGYFKGIEGVVLKVNKKRKLWLGISILGVGATVEIHSDLVEAH